MPLPVLDKANKVPIATILKWFVKGRTDRSLSLDKRFNGVLMAWTGEFRIKPFMCMSVIDSIANLKDYTKAELFKVSSVLECYSYFQMVCPLLKMFSGTGGMQIVMLSLRLLLIMIRGRVQFFNLSGIGRK